MNATAVDGRARCSARQEHENPNDYVDSEPHTGGTRGKRVGPLVQFVCLVNYMPKPTVFWHLADDPTLDRDGIEAQPSELHETPSNRPSGARPSRWAATGRSISSTAPSAARTSKGRYPSGTVEVIDVAEVLLQSHPYTRLPTPTGGEP